MEWTSSCHDPCWQNASVVLFLTALPSTALFHESKKGSQPILTGKEQKERTTVHTSYKPSLRQAKTRAKADPTPRGLVSSSKASQRQVLQPGALPEETWLSLSAPPAHCCSWALISGRTNTGPTFRKKQTFAELLQRSSQVVRASPLPMPPKKH